MRHDLMETVTHGSACGTCPLAYLKVTCRIIYRKLCKIPMIQRLFMWHARDFIVVNYPSSYCITIHFVALRNHPMRQSRHRKLTRKGSLTFAEEIYLSGDLGILFKVIFCCFIALKKLFTAYNPVGFRGSSSLRLAHPISSGRRDILPFSSVGSSSTASKATCSPLGLVLWGGQTCSFPLGGTCPGNSKSWEDLPLSCPPLAFSSAAPSSDNDVLAVEGAIFSILQPPLLTLPTIDYDVLAVVGANLHSLWWFVVG